MLQRLLPMLIAMALVVGAVVVPHAHGADVAVEMIEDADADPDDVIAIAAQGAGRSSLAIAPSRRSHRSCWTATAPPVPPPER